MQQGSHRLEKYLNIQDYLENSLKIRIASKSIGKTLKGPLILLFSVGLSSLLIEN